MELIWYRTFRHFSGYLFYLSNFNINYNANYDEISVIKETNVNLITKDGERINKKGSDKYVYFRTKDECISYMDLVLESAIRHSKRILKEEVDKLEKLQKTQIDRLKFKIIIHAGLKAVD